MSKFEIILIVCACLAPFFAIIFFLPRKVNFKNLFKNLFKKKEKKSAETKSETEGPKMEEKPAQAVEVKPEYRPMVDNSISTDEFKSYLNRREKDISKPKRHELPKDFIDQTMPFEPFERRKPREKKPQSVAEEIQSLSPELKALIISGFLDRKY